MEVGLKQDIDKIKAGDYSKIEAMILLGRYRAAIESDPHISFLRKTGNISYYNILTNLTDEMDHEIGKLKEVDFRKTNWN